MINVATFLLQEISGQKTLLEVKKGPKILTVFEKNLNKKIVTAVFGEHFWSSWSPCFMNYFTERSMLASIDKLYPDRQC